MRHHRLSEHVGNLDTRHSAGLSTEVRDSKREQHTMLSSNRIIETLANLWEMLPESVVMCNTFITIKLVKIG